MPIADLSMLPTLLKTGQSVTDMAGLSLPLAQWRAAYPNLPHASEMGPGARVIPQTALQRANQAAHNSRTMAERALIRDRVLAGHPSSAPARAPAYGVARSGEAFKRIGNSVIRVPYGTPGSFASIDAARAPATAQARPAPAAPTAQARPAPAAPTAQARPAPAAQVRQAAPAPAAQVRQAAPAPAAQVRQAAPAPVHAGLARAQSAALAGAPAPLSASGVKHASVLENVQALMVRAGLRKPPPDSNADGTAIGAGSGALIGLLGGLFNNHRPAASSFGGSLLGAGVGYGIDKMKTAQTAPAQPPALQPRKQRPDTDYSRSLVNQFRPNVDAAGRSGAILGGASGAALLGLIARMVTDNPAIVGGAAAAGGGVGALAARNAARADARTHNSRLLAMRRSGMDNPADLYMALQFPSLTQRVTAPGERT